MKIGSLVFLKRTAGLLILLAVSSPDSLRADNADDRYASTLRSFAESGYTDDELVQLWDLLLETRDPGTLLTSYRQAVVRPAVPENPHSGDGFLAAVAWYKDTTGSDGDGAFTLTELTWAMDEEARQYISIIQSGGTTENRIHSWKWIQKLTLVEKAVLARIDRGEDAWYPYEPTAMQTIDENDPWNAAHTIDDREEFQTRVIRASFRRPVLVKFGLTYCIHCLLLENMGSVPAVAGKYADEIDVVKLWWNPHDPEMSQVNQIAGEEGVSSSPWFILYIDGAQVKSGYAFPDQNGSGMEDFIGPFL